ncbi:MAG TPA: SDR family oxidoreductase, partial [Anaerolineales bacterium]|nr:SDR family oxidoreductase [Anaerolineales bacterium]
MKFLVTGGAGFIGSHIAEALLARGDSVRVLDNFSTGKRENIEALIQKSGRSLLALIEGDIRDASRVGEAVRGMDAVFHSAAFVSVPQSMDEPQECFDVNVSGTHLLLESARRAGVRRVVLASSAAVYGESAV